MEKLKEYYNSMKFIGFFLFSCVIISEILGKEFLNKYLILIFTSQILINADDFINLIKDLGTIKKNEEEKESTIIKKEIRDDPVIRA